MSIRTDESYCFVLPMIARMLPRHSFSSMSSPHLRELDGDVGIGPGALNSLEQVEIGAAGAVRFLGVQHRLAQKVERRAQVARLQVAQRWNRFVYRFASDESRCQFAGESIPSDKPKDARLLAQPEKCSAQHQA